MLADPAPAALLASRAPPPVIAELAPAALLAAAGPLAVLVQLSARNWHPLLHSRRRWRFNPAVSAAASGAESRFAPQVAAVLVVVCGGGGRAPDLRDLGGGGGSSVPPTPCRRSSSRCVSPADGSAEEAMSARAAPRARAPRFHVVRQAMPGRRCRTRRTPRPLSRAQPSHGMWDAETLKPSKLFGKV